MHAVGSWRITIPYIKRLCSCSYSENREVAQARLLCSCLCLMTEHTSGALICYRLTLVAWHERHFTHCSARAVQQTQGHVLSRVLLLGQQPMCTGQIKKVKILLLWKVSIMHQDHPQLQRHTTSSKLFSSVDKNSQRHVGGSFVENSLWGIGKSLLVSESTFTINHKTSLWRTIVFHILYTFFNLFCGLVTFSAVKTVLHQVKITI